jgi:hypothetical protein
MEITKILELIASIIAGIAVCIPLVIKLVEYIKEAAKAREYQKLIKLVMKFCTEAELLFGDGKQKKEWVLHRVKEVADAMNIEMDMDAISLLIDDLVSASKLINMNPTKESGK